MRPNRRRPSALLFLLLLCLAPSLSGAGANGQEAPAPGPGHIEVRLRPDKETIMQGEAAYVSFEVKNLSGKDLCLGVGGDYRNSLGRPNSFKVSVTGGDGKAVPQPEVTLEFGGFSGCARVPANGSHAIRLFMPHWATFERPGSYTVNVRRPLAFYSYEPDPRGPTYPTPRFVMQADVSAPLAVAPYDENRMGELIDALGGAMLDAEDPSALDAARALAYLDDERAVPYLAAALKKFGKFEFGDGGNEYLISSKAVAALSRYGVDSAVEALGAAVHSPSEDTREGVAAALAYGKHPRAAEYLLLMQNDQSWLVRLRVVYGLKSAESAEALAALRKMLKDENEDVRKAARAGLKARREK